MRRATAGVELGRRAILHGAATTSAGSARLLLLRSIASRAAPTTLRPTLPCSCSPLLVARSYSKYRKQMGRITPASANPTESGSSSSASSSASASAFKIELPSHYRPKAQEGPVRLPLSEYLRMFGNRIYSFVLHPAGFLLIFFVFVGYLGNAENRARRKQEQQRFVEEWKADHDRPFKETAASAASSSVSASVQPSADAAKGGPTSP